MNKDNSITSGHSQLSCEMRIKNLVNVYSMSSIFSIKEDSEDSFK